VNDLIFVGVFVAFSLGLILVVVAGAELFTGNNLFVMATVTGRIPPSRRGRWDVSR
jgi:formate/nitrite transporter FocA (FNT family)